MKTFTIFLLGAVLGAYVGGQIHQAEAVKQGHAVWVGNKFKWKECK